MKAKKRLTLFTTAFVTALCIIFTANVTVPSVAAEKALPEITSEPVAAEGLVYNGEEQSLLKKAGTAVGGKLRYSIDGINYFNYDELPKVKKARKDYTVYYKVIGDADHKNSEVKSITNIEIAPFAAEVEWGSKTEFTYDGKVKSVTAVVKNRIGNDNVNLILSENEKTDKGGYYAEIVGIDNDNYTLDKVAATDLKRFWKINPRDITNADVELDGTLIYNGEAQTQKVLSVISDGVWLKTNQYTISGNTGTVATSYELTITPTDDNFVGEAKKSFSIAKRPVDIEWQKSTGITYDGKPHTVTPVVKNICDGDVLDLETGGIITATDSDTYLAKVTSVSNDNYTLEGGKRVQTNWTISQKTLTVDNIETIKNQIYSGEAIEPEIILNGVNAPLILGTDYTVSYENNINAGVAVAKVTILNKNYTGKPKKYFNILSKKINPAIILTAPVKYATPQTSIETAEYTADVIWSPAISAGGAFEKNTEYTAMITVTPKTNYTTVGIAENEYTVTDADSVTNAADSNVLTAVFPATAGGREGGTSQYTVKFNTNGGNAITSQTVKKNGTATEPANPTKEGYIFDGWYTDSECATEYDFDAAVTKNITLYAKWIEDETREPSDDKKDDDSTAGNWQNPFDDVTENDWYFDNVKYVNKNGLMSGTTKTTFAPNESITRAMLVTVLYRLEGKPEMKDAQWFKDVAKGQWYSDAVAWATFNGITTGYGDGNFGPDEKITREQIAVILYRYAKYKGVAPTGAWAIKLDYADAAEISDYAVEGVMYCTMKNIMQGKNNNMFAPKAFATRAEIAAILNRYIEGNK